MSLSGSMWGVCSGLRLRKPLAAVGGMTRYSTVSAFHHYTSNGQKGQPACFSHRNSLFLWRQQRDRVEQFVPALRASAICPAAQQQSVQLRDRRSNSLPFLTIFTRLPNQLTSVTWKSLAILPPGPGTGVPFHWHGPGFAEVIYGKKVNGDLDVWFIRFHHSRSLAWLKDHLLFVQRWFFYPPEREPHFDRNRTTLSWVTEVYPNLPEDEAPLECTLRPGEVTTHISWNMDTQGFMMRTLLQHLRTDYGLTVVRFCRARFFQKSPLDGAKCDVNDWTVSREYQYRKLEIWFWSFLHSPGL